MMQHKSDGLRTSVIFYEVVADGAEKAMSRFFTSRSPLESREQALRYFLEQFFYIEVKREETTLYVYCRHHEGERILLLTSQTFQKPGTSFYALERELLLYKTERLAVHMVLFDQSNPESVTIFFPGPYQSVHNTGSRQYLLANNYWIFLRRKAERYRI
ncbi:MAG: hypothetical protein EOO04_06540 [Chitinophagaceae bacterium]|nr:MAG: hypothetical protein EOO04_06540 [Chitinophagaceae bacterium]